MRGFMLDDKGDLSITNNEIDLIDGNELKAQTIQCVLSTNKGEWFFDEEEGINFDNILGKKRVKTTSATASYYQGEIASHKREDDRIAEKLRKRLDGE